MRILALVPSAEISNMAPILYEFNVYVYRGSSRITYLSQVLSLTH
jgi:hypothetical protein